VLLDRGSDVAQKRVTGAMTMAVVDLLEPVNVDVGEHQLPALAARTVDLAVEQQQPDLAAKRAGELIQLRTSQVISPQAVIAVGARSIFDRRLAIGGRVLTISDTFATVDGPLPGSGLVEVVVRRGLLSVNGSSVPILSRLISIRGPLPGRRLGVIALRGILVAVSGGVSAVSGGVLAVRGPAVGVGR
jgi:hypothetical protein